MLANLLAVVMGVGSLAFYLAAFIVPEVHRRSDFFWSGVGMFYAVVLWSCARQMHGAVLLGQTASVGLLLWLGYQTLLLRRLTTPAAQQTPIQWGKSERSRSTNRPITRDYEFVEDGVEDREDIEDEVPDPDSPILLEPTADDFVPKMVVPAAISQPTIKEDIPEKSPTENTPDTFDTPTVPKPAKQRERLNPIAAVGIFVGWMKDLATPQKKMPKPMIELPPRPPSIPKTGPKADVSDETVASSDSTAPTASQVIATKNTEPSPQPVSTTQKKEEEEDSNWPDDNFWN